MNYRKGGRRQRGQHFAAAVSAASLLLLGACSGAGSEAGRIPEAPALAQTDQTANLPEGVDAGLWASLVAELERVMAEEGTAKRSSAVPAVSAASVQTLRQYSTGGVSGFFSWYYDNPGDYDLNGLVTISDLTQVGLHFGKTFSDDDWLVAQTADGDGNGEVNIGDVTPIGQNFGGQIDGYLFQNRLDSGSEYNSGETFPFVPGDPSSGQLVKFDRPYDGFFIAGSQFRVVPYVDDGGGPQTGVPSNELTMGLSGRFNWPTFRADNERSCNSRASGPITNNVLWEASLNTTPFLTSGAVSDVNGTIYVPGFAGSIIPGEDSTGGLQAYSRSGSRLWSMPIDAAVLSTPCINLMGEIIFGDVNGTVHAMNAEGKLLWRTELTAPVTISCPLSNSDGTYFAASELFSDFAVICKLLPDGSIDWTKILPDNAVGSPVQSADLIGIADSDGNMPFYDSGGNVVEDLNIESGLSSISAPFMLGTHVIYAAESPEALHSVPVGIGVPGVYVPDDSISGGAALNSQNQLIVGIENSVAETDKLVVLDSLFAELNSTPLPGSVMIQIVTDRDDKIYLSALISEDGTALESQLLCFAADLSLLWSYSEPGLLVLPVAIVDSDRLAALVFTESSIGGGPSRLLIFGGDA